MAGPRQESERLRVFISYSRDDIEFADQVDVALDGTGFRCTVDRHDIAGADEWKRRLGELIRDADAIIFVLSPSSAGSPVCAWEVAESERLGKRIIPVLCRPLADARPPTALADLNYIHFYKEEKVPGSGFGSGIAKLLAALKEDPVWLREHTRLLGLAMHWESAGRPANRLLSGDDITSAKAWLAERRSSRTEPTELHLEYIKASEAWHAEQQSERRRQLEEREALVLEAEQHRAAREEAQAQATQAAKREAAQARRVARRTLAGLIASLVLAALAGGATLFARDQADRNRRAQLAAEDARHEAVGEATKARAAEKEVRAANTRLSAKMRLSMALLGEQRVEVGERWYELATTNAASIVLIYLNATSPSGTGFLVRGGDLYEGWGDEVLVVTAEHVLPGDGAPLPVSGPIADRRVEVAYPILQPDRKTRVVGVMWRSNEDLAHSGTGRGVDIAVLRLAEPPPEGATVVRLPDQYDVTSWPVIDDPRQPGPLDAEATLMSIGYFESQHAGSDTAGDDRSNEKPGLTFAISRAVGRLDHAGGPLRIFYTDATGRGSSGTPVFDASSGVLVAIEQLDFVGLVSGVLMTAVREAIRRGLAGLPTLEPVAESVPPSDTARLPR